MTRQQRRQARAYLAGLAVGDPVAVRHTGGGRAAGVVTGLTAAEVRVEFPGTPAGHYVGDTGVCHTRYSRTSGGNLRVREGVAADWIEIPAAIAKAKGVP